MLKARPFSHAIARAVAFAFTVGLLLSLSASLQAQSPTAETGRILPSKYINTYVSVMDPNIVEDVFGKRISDRFVVIQVTISNKNGDYQFLIHDVSLDLKNVFGKTVADQVDKEASDRCQSCTASCMDRSQPRGLETDKQTDARFNQCRTNCGRVCSAGRIRFELSSLELSLIRGVAEKGMAQDKRNKILRYLEGIGTVAASIVGVAGFGPSYSDAAAIFNGDFLAAYRHVYPDFTINQMNRLSDSAYKSNTLIPKEQAKVIVAFIPQLMFLRPEQRKTFRKDPTALYPENGAQPYPVDFRKAVALVDGAFIVEVENLPITVTGVQVAPEEALGFLKTHPVVRGYVLGQFLEGSNIGLMNAPDGVQITLDKQATPEEGKLFFVIEASEPIPNGTTLNFRVFDKQNAQVFSETVSYVIPAPTLDPPAVPLEGTVGGPDVEITLTGKNLIPDITQFGMERTSGVTYSFKITKADGGPATLKATLKMAQAKEGTYRIRVSNGPKSADVGFTVKPKTP